jgi:hypothetical protein
MLVTNLKSDLEVWIPKRLISQILGVDDPLLTVCLLRELEYKAGSLCPSERRVVELPVVQRGSVAGGPEIEKDISRIPDRTASESRGGRWLLAALGAVLAACCVFAVVYWLGSRWYPGPAATDQRLLALSARDDYSSVVRRLGPPAREDLRSQSGKPVYRALWYPQRSYYVILSGSSRDAARYIGALDRDWRVIHHVEVPGSGDTEPMLRRLPRF